MSVRECALEFHDVDSGQKRGCLPRRLQRVTAAAILSGCNTLYTEDLEHGRTFDGQLTLVDPFVAV